MASFIVTKFVFGNAPKWFMVDTLIRNFLLPIQSVMKRLGALVPNGRSDMVGFEDGVVRIGD
jgi:hypothetical protein